MHAGNIELLSQEAERLLNLILTTLTDIQENPSILLDEPDTQKQLAFTADGVSRQIETLQDERDKLLQQEMVLAVVGTMKAGKSTVINAIVGTEVLPNRNRPMTALPTLIRHTKGQQEPVLHFTHIQPINHLMASLHQALVSIERQQLSQRLELDADLNALLDQITDGVPFAAHYQGSDNIFHCLKSLNDLVRLSTALNIAFPFNEYATVKNIPVICVEFAHLAELSEGHGQLTLLDTPGPNEAGQGHLKEMLDDQLGKASAVLLVMDYTQLKSTSDADVRQSVAAVGQSVPLYVLVNKFDQKDRHGDDEQQVKAWVAGSLMKKDMTASQVFPVAAKWGYLANRARHEIHLHGALPTPEGQNWVVDFAEEAIGKRWKPADLQETQGVMVAAEDLWKDSLFSAPVKAVIQTAYYRAALYALKSASEKLVKYASDATEYFSFRAEGLAINIADLQKNVTALESDICLLSGVQQQVKTKIDEEVQQADRQTAQHTADITLRINQQIDQYFKDGKVAEKKRTEEKALIEKKNRTSGRKGPNALIHSWVNIFSDPRSPHPDEDDGKDFDAQNDRIEFDDQLDAKALLNKISASVDTILDEGKEDITTGLNEVLSHLEISLLDTLADNIRPIEDKIKAALDDAGFTITLSFPVFNVKKLKFSANRAFDKAIKQEIKTVTHHRRKDNLWGALCSLLDTDDWGWEEYNEKEERYVIILSKLKGSMQQQINALSDTINQAITAQIAQPVQDEMDSFFSDFSAKLEGVRANLQQSIVDQQQETASLMHIKKQLGHFSTSSQHIRQDSEALKHDVDALFPQAAE
ncbi:dynamin family protein [Budvicia aquatica]|uniref:Clamp-binding protein CrfC n=1 Tax=Budvicia aquatica TaxID=82979 RepID=A0A2C6DLX1_9GAMM|nr:dynamin family protein [Budvicia aquatica]PHI32246.1 clamp-binding protein CrfC [Budvicia aquatica]VFS45162.1 Predicted GTPase [Budvicia aquatica]